MRMLDKKVYLSAEEIEDIRKWVPIRSRGIDGLQIFVGSTSIEVELSEI